MPRDPNKLLQDIKEAAEFILEQTRGRSLVDYEGSRLLRSAVERNFIIIGEAIRRLTRFEPQRVAAIGEFPQIIGVRNIIVHGYDVLDDAIVWGIIENEVPRLLDVVRNLLQNGL